jgi:hypothetical protein
MRRTTVLAGSLLLAVPLMTGCIIGNWQKDQKPTMGQQLVDLKTAYDRGALSEQEYNQQRQVIMSGQEPASAPMMAADPMAVPAVQ